MNFFKFILKLAAIAILDKVIEFSPKIGICIITNFVFKSSLSTLKTC